MRGFRAGSVSPFIPPGVRTEFQDNWASRSAFIVYEVFNGETPPCRGVSLADGAVCFLMKAPLFMVLDHGVKGERRMS